MLTDYVTLVTAPNRAPEVGAAVATLAHSAETAGVFVPQIGMSINRVLVLIRGETIPQMEDAWAALNGIDQISNSSRIRLTPVQERALNLVEPCDAVFTNRWFHVQEPGADEFESDTLAAWDTFEGQTDTGVVGLWKTEPDAGIIRYFLVARYADLAAWDASRFWNRKGKQAGADWVARFERRRQRMTDSSVITTRCIGARGET